MAGSQISNELFQKGPAAASAPISSLLFNRCLFESHPIPDTWSASASAAASISVASCRKKHSRLFEESEFKFVTVFAATYPGGFCRQLTVGKNESVGLTFRGPLFFCFSAASDTQRPKLSTHQTTSFLFLLFVGIELLTVAAAAKYA